MEKMMVKNSLDQTTFTIEKKKKKKLVLSPQKAKPFFEILQNIQILLVNIQLEKCNFLFYPFTKNKMHECSKYAPIELK